MAIPTANGNNTGFKQKKEKKEFTAIPEGEYEVEVARAEYRTRDNVSWQWPSWKKSDQEVNFGFRITEGDYKGRWVWFDAAFFPQSREDAIVTSDLNDKSNSRLRIALQELTGFDKLPENLEINVDELDEFEGFDARVRVSTYQTKAGETKNDVKEVLRSLNSSAEYSDVDEVF